MTKQLIFMQYNIENIGKIISITGVALFGVSLIGYLHKKEQLTIINQEKELFRSEIQREIDYYIVEIDNLNRTQDLCKEWYDKFREGNPVLPQKRDCEKSQERAEAKSYIDKEIQKAKNKEDKGLQDYDQNINQKHSAMKTFYYSSIVTGLLTFSGILMMFGQRILNVMSGERIINTNGGEYRETNLHDKSRSIETKGNSKYYEKYNQSQKNLADAAAEIQKLLKQLEQTNPTATEVEKTAYVNDETTPSFKRKAASALQAAGESAIEEFLDNPYVNVGKAVIKGWIEA